ncbi:MAG TPA: thiol-disulfide oxidoreductase DCC family protein [Longimicrobiales bacterium]|nr:thiol-disulfide oxidoreductase DCC family protein [Longimicrobiales bacterium]
MSMPSASAAGASAADSSKPRSIILFDGVCNLCNGAVQFVLDRDPAARFQFASLQSAAAGDLLRAPCDAAADLSSIVLLEDGRCHTRSTAALRIARRLSGAWPLLYGLILVPRPVRDGVYSFIASHRYRWFGRSESCRVPTPETRSRFLD